MQPASKTSGDKSKVYRQWRNDGVAAASSDGGSGRGQTKREKV